MSDTVPLGSAPLLAVCGAFYHPILRFLIYVLFGGAAVYAILQTMGMLPAGW